MDFYDPTTGIPRETITNVKPWMAHILQSHAINLATSNLDSETVWSTKAAVKGIPRTFFFNVEGLGAVIPGIDQGASTSGVCTVPSFLVDVSRSHETV